MRNILLLLTFSVFSGAAVVGPALLWPQRCEAQTIRQLPANGKRGTTGDKLPYPQVAIGRETFALAPGGIIYDTNNRTIVQGALPADADVWYQLNNTGQVQRIYVLRPEEQARLEKEKKFFFF